MKLLVPAGTGTLQTSDGLQWVPDASGMLDIGAHDPADFLAMGCVFVSNDGGPSAARPGAPAPYQCYFDTTLGTPVWWNPALTHWVNATGAQV